MGIFDRVDFDEYQEFQGEVRAKLTGLEKQIQLKVTDSEEAARTAASNALEAEGKVHSIAGQIEASLRDLQSYKQDALAELEEVRQKKDEIVASNGDLLLKIQETQNLYSQIAESKKTVDQAANDISQKVTEISAYLEQSKSLPSDVDATQKLLDECNGICDSVTSIRDHCVKKKTDVDELYKEIYGEDIQDTSGKSEHVDGIRDELKKSYNDISVRLDEVEDRLKEALGAQKYEQSIEEQKAKFNRLIDDSEARVKAVNDQLTGLLPGAMAEGLSAAYEKKKNDEVSVLEKSESSFKTAIKALVLTAFIPFAVDLYLLAGQEKDLVEVIKDTPSLIVAILPLYFPILWLAYSSNKKVNLSKRLIEEYTHKAVLGKTFSGLSNQIETLQHQSEIKDELRTRLLFNVLQVSAENPGKLITDYNKSDHPIMDALEKSAKLSESVDALSKIPGFSALAKKIADKSEQLFDSHAQKVKRGLLVEEAMNGPLDPLPDEKSA